MALATTVMVAVPADVNNCPAVAIVGDDESLLPSITLKVAIQTKKKVQNESAQGPKL